jgi:exonuclease SbcC
MSNIPDALYKKYEGLERVRDGIFKATLRHNDNAYAVHYFDTSNKIDDPDFDLEQYQNDLLSKDYYSKSGPIQWNYYVSFIVDGGFQSRRGSRKKYIEIERNKSLARKKIFTEVEFLDDLNRELLVFKDDIISPISVWGYILRKEGYGDFLNEDLSVEKVVENIAHPISSGKIETKRNEFSSARKIRSIDEISIIKYRKKLDGQIFKFKKINLIKGENAAGKTSLLEAIEAAICGGTARDPSNSPEFEFRAKFNGEVAFETVLKRGDSHYRNLDKEWYGSYYRSGNKLPQSFSRFNYFDADAAIRFSKHVDNNESIDAVSGILYGEEARRYEVRFKSILKKLKNKEFSAGNEIIRLTKLESDLLASISESGGDVDAAEDISPENLVAAGVRAERALSIEQLEEYISALDLPISSIEAQDVFLENIPVKDLAKISNDRKSFYDHLMDIENKILKNSILYKELINSEGFIRVKYESVLRLKEYKECAVIDELLAAEARRDNNKKLLEKTLVLEKSYREIDGNVISKLDLDITPRLAILNIKNEESNALKKASELDLNIKKLTNSREEFSRSLSDIQISSLDFVRSNNLMECPVCGERHGESGLIERISNQLESAKLASDDSLSVLLDERRFILESIKDIPDVMNSLVLLDAISNSSGIEADVTVSDLISHLSEVVANKENVISSIDDEEGKIRSLAKKGFSLNELLSIKETLGFDLLEEINIEAIELDLNNRLKSAGVGLKKIEIGVASAETELSSALSQFSVFKRSVESSGDFISLADRGCRVLNAVDVIGGKLIISDSASLNEIIDFCSDAQRLLMKLSVNREKTFRRNKNVAEISRVRSALGFNRQIVADCKSAGSVMEEIVVSHSLEKMLSEFMSFHIKAIENIFLSIHAPREFSEIRYQGSELALVRSDKSVSSVLQLSTGQRTALALSIFLVMNALSTDGPKFLMFDDPVAYVDDLNALAFFDFLRDYSKSSDRQIFLATANNKIASLFEKKFNFLGHDYSPISLDRFAGEA